MARRDTTQRKILVTVLAWVVGLMVFFPILWTVLTSFKTEGDAINISSFFSTGWTTEAYSVVQSRSNYVQFAMNSVILALGSTFFALVIAIPSAWAMAFAPSKKTKDLLMKAKVEGASFIGDKDILKAMLSNEEDAVTAYERMNKRVNESSDQKIAKIIATMHEDLQYDYLRDMEKLQ